MNIRCIKCQSENSFLNRQNNDRRCRNCNHQFVFEPCEIVPASTAPVITNPGIVNRVLRLIFENSESDLRFRDPTDPMFENTIDELSANNTLFFTEHQLIYCLNKRLRRDLDSPSADPDFFRFFSLYFQLLFIVGVGMSIKPTLLTFGIILQSRFAFIAAMLIWEGLKIWILYNKSTSKTRTDRQRKISARQLKNIGFFILLTIIPISLTIAPSFILFTIGVLMGMGSIHLSNRPIIKELFVDLDRIQSLSNRWEEVNGNIVKLLPPPHTQMGNSVVNPQITPYSFDRLVVCQSAEVAQMLIANNFHSENSCAILSIDGYPENIFDVTIQVLRHNTNLKVYTFHDCSPQGMKVLHQLKNSDRWFKDSNVAIIDVGLTPSQVMTSKHVFLQTSVESAAIVKGVPASEWIGLRKYEISWLKSGNYIELASFTPQQSIQILNRGIAGTRNLLDEIDFYPI